MPGGLGWPPGNVEWNVFEDINSGKRNIATSNEEIRERADDYLMSSMPLIYAF